VSNLFGFLKKKERDAPEEIRLGQPSEEELVSFVDDEFKRRQNERRPIELQWRLNAAFKEGNQYIDINSAAMTLVEIPKLYYWQEREVFNHIGPIVETRIAKLSRSSPILKVQPGSGETEDIHAAKVGAQLLKNTFNDKDLRRLQVEANAWNEICGSVFFKNVWNPNLGPVIGIQQDETGNQSEVKEGDLDVILCPAQEIFPDSIYRQSVQQCKSIIHAKAFRIDEIYDLWGVEVPSEGGINVLQLQQVMIGQGGLGYGMGGFGYNVSSLKDHAYVKEYYERPTRRYPKGRLIIVAGKKLLYQGDLPWPVEEDGQLGLPFVKYDCLTKPGCFFGSTIIERCIPVQRRFNALKNRKTEYLNRVAIGQWNIEEGAVDEDQFEEDAGAPGAVHIYKKGFAKPEPVVNAPLPPQFDTEEQSLLTMFSMLSGVSEMSRMSQAPPGVKSGVALSIATEQDDTRLATTAGNFDIAMIQNGKQWLRLYKKFATGQRTLRRINRNNVVELLDWTGADIRSDDVILDTSSALAESPAQRRQMIFDLLSTPLFLDPDTGKIDRDMRSKIFEMIELGNWESADDFDEAHISKAERENRMLKQNMLPKAANYDHHFLHIKHHNQYRLTVEYEDMVRQNPMIDQLYQAHVDQHLQILAQTALQNAGQPIVPQAI
jgi:hypothetical protein